MIFEWYNCAKQSVFKTCDHNEVNVFDHRVTNKLSSENFINDTNGSHSCSMKRHFSSPCLPRRKLSQRSANSSHSNSLSLAIIHPQGLISSQWAHQNYYSSSTCLYYPISLLSPPFCHSLPISHLVSRPFTFRCETFQALFFLLLSSSKIISHTVYHWSHCIVFLPPGPWCVELPVYLTEQSYEWEIRCEILPICTQLLDKIMINSGILLKIVDNRSFIKRKMQRLLGIEL